MAAANSAGSAHARYNMVTSSSLFISNHTHPVARAPVPRAGVGVGPHGRRRAAPVPSAWWASVSGAPIPAAAGARGREGPAGPSHALRPLSAAGEALLPPGKVHLAARGTVLQRQGQRITGERAADNPTPSPSKRENPRYHPFHSLSNHNITAKRRCDPSYAAASSDCS